MLNYNIFSQTLKEIEDFNNPIKIADTKGSPDSVKFLSTGNKGYLFSQKDTLNLIDLYDNSKFETSPKDSEGQEKIFLNIGNFRRKVAAKQIRLGVKDYLFIPDDYASIWKAWFMARQFKVWSRENNQGELINELEENFPKYGTIVTKKVGKKVERVNLKSLINTQDAKSLKEAATSGGYVIETHEFSKYELKKFKDWKTEGLSFEPGKKKTVYERYALTPRWVVDEFEGKTTEDEDEVLAMAVLTCEYGKKKEGIGHLLYVQEISEDDFPYEEEHWDRQDGRWLGIGEVENQFENQFARNLSFNLRRRSLLWAAKKIFQSPDESIQRNLVKDVRDGQIMHIMPNGNVTPIDTSSRHLADFNTFDQAIEENANQKSFTFEVASGEALPSGTPFRLGVLLSNAVNSHFEAMREKLGLFLIRSYYNQIVPIFKKETKDHVINVASSEEGIGHLKEALLRHFVWDKFKDMLLSGNIPNLQVIESEARKHLESQRYHFIEIPKGFYDDCKFHMELEITGQAIDTKQELETLTNVFTVISQNPAALQNPQLMRLLEIIVSKTGKTLKDFMGEIKTAVPASTGGQMQPMASAGMLPAVGQQPAGNVPPVGQ
jgi:hypothetical protein